MPSPTLPIRAALFVIAGLFEILAIMVMPAHATPVPSTSGSIVVTVGANDRGIGSGDSVTSLLAPGANVLIDGRSIAGASASGIVNVNPTAGLGGELGVLAAGSVGTAGLLQLGTGNFWGASYQAEAHASWTDAFVPTSKTLPVGTAIQAKIGFLFEGSTSGDATAFLHVGDSEFARGTVSGGLFLADPDTGETGFVPPIASACAVTNPLDVNGSCGLVPVDFPFQTQQSVILNLIVGQPFGLVGIMDASTFGTVSGPFPDFLGLSLVIDATNTARTTLEPLGDFTLVSASGLSYAPAASNGVVAEPETFTLLGLALGGLGVARRRSWRTLFRAE